MSRAEEAHQWVLKNLYNYFKYVQDCESPWNVSSQFWGICKHNFYWMILSDPEALLEISCIDG